MIFKRLFRFCISLLILLGLVFGALAYYFRHVSHFRTALLASVQANEQMFHVHSMTYTEIPQMYRNAVIATEDRRFWWDPGIDPIGIARSLMVDIQQRKFVQGGSTITQQIADNTLLTRQKSLGYKLQQTFDAIGIYDTFAKPETFDIYANIIYFGHGAYGLYNASETYFGTTPNHLNDGELTMLAGLPNAPSMYDPFTNLTLARQRQSLVLQDMVSAGMLTSQQAKAIWNMPIRLVSQG